MMTRISRSARKVLEALIQGLERGDSRKLDNGGAGIMPVSVERLSNSTYSVAHYYAQNGDLMADPEMVFWRGPEGDFYPVHFQQDNMGTFQVAMQLAAGEVPRDLNARAQRAQASFTNTWMRNIAQQQRLFAKA